VFRFPWRVELNVEAGSGNVAVLLISAGHVQREFSGIGGGAVLWQRVLHSDVRQGGFFAGLPLLQKTEMSGFTSHETVFDIARSLLVQ